MSHLGYAQRYIKNHQTYLLNFFSGCFRTCVIHFHFRCLRIHIYTTWLGFLNLTNYIPLMLAGPINSIDGLFHHAITLCDTVSFHPDSQYSLLPKQDWVVQRGFISVAFVNEQVHQFTIKSSCKYSTCNMSGNCQITYHQRIRTVPNLEVLKLIFGCLRGCGFPYP